VTARFTRILGAALVAMAIPYGVRSVAVLTHLPGGVTARVLDEKRS
jgi:hypothetical protein